MPSLNYIKIKRFTSSTCSYQPLKREWTGPFVKTGEFLSAKMALILLNSGTCIIYLRKKETQQTKI